MAHLLINDKNSWNLEDNPIKLNLNYWLKKNTNDTNDKNDVLFTFYKNDMLIPFSVGKRDCIESFFANLLLKYKIIAPNNDHESMNIKYKYGGGTAVVEPQIPVQICKL